ERLSRSLPVLGFPLHAAVLGCFLHAWGGPRGEDRFLVDVESHGRTTFSDQVDVSRVVGWFTATAPAAVEVAKAGAGDTVRAVAAALESAAGRASGGSGRPAGPQAGICFNYLGRFALPPDEHLGLTASRFPIGPARGGRNDRVHD